MKKVLIVLSISLLALSCGQKGSGYTITVNFDPELTDFKENAKVIVNNRDTAFAISDSAIVTNSVAVLKGSVKNPDFVVLAGYTEDSSEKPDYLSSFYLENANYEINVTKEGNRTRADITSDSKIQNIRDSINDERMRISAEYRVDSLENLYRLAYRDNDQSKAEEIREEIMPIYEKIDAVEENYLAGNPDPLYKLIDVASNANYIPIDSAKKELETFSENKELKGNKFLAQLKSVVDIKESLSAGKQAPDFTLDDPDGNPVTLSEFYAKNKITMIDFWASWCGPCRAFNPTLTKIYAKYKDKGFGIIGVSLDRERESWVQAIESDGLVWTHVSDLQYWNSYAAKLFNIRYIPQSYFVDSTGKIVLQSPDEEEIEKFLEETFNE